MEKIKKVRWGDPRKVLKKLETMVDEDHWLGLLPGARAGKVCDHANRLLRGPHLTLAEQDIMKLIRELALAIEDLAGKVDMKNGK